MIINRLRGQAEARVGADTLTLVFDNTAFLALEDITGRAFLDVIGELFASEQTGAPAKLGTMQALLWAGLRDRHPEVGATDCGDLYVMFHTALLPAIVAALIGALPQRKADDAGEAAATTKTGTSLKKPAKKRRGSGTIG